MTKIVTSQIKEFIKENGSLSVTSEFFPALEKQLEGLIADACKRCIANGRKTVMLKDL